MNASTHEINVPDCATPVLVQAVEPQPGLHIYPTPEEIADPGDTYIWRLGHHSGHVIAKFEHRDEAEEAAEALRGITNWTRPANEIRRDVDIDRVLDALEQSPGIFLLGSDA